MFSQSVDATDLLSTPNAHSTPCTSNDVERERDMLRRERELLLRERELLDRERELYTNRNNATITQCVPNVNAERLVPDFEPSKLTGLTAKQWIQRIDGIAQAYGWDDISKLSQAIGKLKGAAKYWFEGVAEEITTWNDFKAQLICSFPSTHDTADIHMELIKRKKGRDEDYETYVYVMKSIAKKGGIEDSSLIKYVLNGIDNRELARSLSLCEFNGIEDFLKKIKTYVSVNDRSMTEKPRNYTKNPARQQTVQPSSGKEKHCFKCNGMGHFARDCKERKSTELTCFRCGSKGHFAKNCTQTGNQQVKKIGTEQTKSKNDEYHKTVQVDGKKLIAFIDMGSDCVTIRKDDADKENLKYVPYAITLLGFGSGECKTLGKRTSIVEIGDVKAEVEILVVPNESQDDAIIIGRSFLDNPNIIVILKKGTLEIKNSNEAEENKVLETKSIFRVRNAKPLQKEEIVTGDTVDDTVKETLCNLFNEYRDCFAENMSELGCTNLSTFKIEVTETSPIVYKPYRLPYAQQPKMKKIIEELFDAGVICEATSEYASPAILVSKKTGDERMCIDYRRLNNITRKESFPMPNMEEQLDHLANNNYFCMLDLASGYYQIPVEPESQKYTAFVTQFGCYQFTRMPFGLVNAPAAFNKLMAQVKKMSPANLMVYMDDVLLPCRSVEEGISTLQHFLDVLRQVGLTLKCKKCIFFSERVEYLGYEIDQEGVRPGKRKTKAIEEFQRPVNVHEVRQFLGLSSFFRKFIRSYATISKPLSQLLRKNEPYVWTESQEEAFSVLKRKLCERPVLTLFDMEARHEVHTDASRKGLSGILIQEKDESKLPVAYYSRQTSEMEQKYHSYELEALVVVEALTKFRVYLLYRKFIVVTDCSSLKTAMNSKELIPRIGRWWLKLQEFDFEIKHRPGERMQHANALSRNPTENPEEPEVANVQVMMMRIDNADWLLTLQKQDPKILAIHEELLRPPAEATVKQIHEDYKLDKGRIYRKIGSELKWVVPTALRSRIVRENHDEIGHYGVEKTLERIKKNYWFHRMRRYVKSYIASCPNCAYHKLKGGKGEGELFPIPKIPIPFHTCHIDHLGFYPKSKSKNQYVIAFVDSFTKFIILRAVKDTKTQSVIKGLNEITEIFGTPSRLISDRGTAYTSKKFEKYCVDNEIQHIKNATATPRANGQIERYNKVIADAISAMSETEDGTDWEENLRAIQWGLNSIPHKTTKKSPHELLFAYEPRNILQNKILLTLQDDETNETNTDLEVIRETARKALEKDGKQQKERYDKRKRKAHQYKVNDMVLIRRESPATGTSKKLMPKYRGPYLVTEILPHDRYVLKDIPGAERSQRPFDSVFSADRMKPWCTLPEEDEEEDETDDNSNSSTNEVEDDLNKQDGRVVSDQQKSIIK